MLSCETNLLDYKVVVTAENTIKDIKLVKLTSWVDQNCFDGCLKGQIMKVDLNPIILTLLSHFSRAVTYIFHFENCAGSTVAYIKGRFVLIFLKVRNITDTCYKGKLNLLSIF